MTAIPTQLASFEQKSALRFYEVRYYALGDVAPLSVKLTMLSLPLRQQCRREGCREI